jgi:hypothetical protein
MKYPIFAAFGAIAFALLLPPSAQAGVYTDDLTKCLVSSTTDTERNTLVKWIFAVMSSHPEVKSIAAVSDAKIDVLNKDAAALFMKLLTESCRAKTEQALKYEGSSAIGASFQVLGQVAGRELFASPAVAKNMAGMQKYIDEKKIQGLMNQAK